MNQSQGNTDFIFGTHPIIEAMRNGKEMEKILIVQGTRSPQIAEIVGMAKELQYPVQFVPIEKLNRITRKNHQGILAFVSPISYQLIEQLIPMIYDEGRTPFILLLDRITDVRNFGAICRSAEAAGVDAVVVPSRGSALVNADAMKTSAGALSKINLCRVDNLKITIDFLKESGLKIAAVSEKTELNAWDNDLSGPIALLMGSEEDGISEAYLKKADVHVKFPMVGTVESLNVSVAAGIACFEILRQRFGQK
ncbi:MAG: 23S rRNA (guanosine(2251)-2'-O)-methyltransferase RlmB [Bacteroidales bacterium]|nr:23S rRNA (guanosine(2251)-2'-O)-methyltransferase RlmB [Bacteroidales bacterium]